MTKLEKLISEHPILQDVRCGVSIGDGWVDILASAVLRLEKNCPGVSICQVKEKFGGLRLYVDLEDGAHDLVVNSANRIVSTAERRAWQTCEWCGAHNQDKLVMTKGPWLKTLCVDCHQERDEQRRHSNR